MMNLSRSVVGRGSFAQCLLEFCQALSHLTGSDWRVIRVWQGSVDAGQSVVNSVAICHIINVRNIIFSMEKSSCFHMSSTSDRCAFFRAVMLSYIAQKFTSLSEQSHMNINIFVMIIIYTHICYHLWLGSKGVVRHIFFYTLYGYRIYNSFTQFNSV